MLFHLFRFVLIFLREIATSLATWAKRPSTSRGETPAILRYKYYDGCTNVCRMERRGRWHWLWYCGFYLVRLSYIMSRGRIIKQVRLFNCFKCSRLTFKPRRERSLSYTKNNLQCLIWHVFSKSNADFCLTLVVVKIQNKLQWFQWQNLVIFQPFFFVPMAFLLFKF